MPNHETCHADSDELRYDWRRTTSKSSKTKLSRRIVFYARRVTPHRTVQRLRDRLQGNRNRAFRKLSPSPRIEIFATAAISQESNRRIPHWSVPAVGTRGNLTFLNVALATDRVILLLQMQCQHASDGKAQNVLQYADKSFSRLSSEAGQHRQGYRRTIAPLPTV
jgi:hypothetical protein